MGRMGKPELQESNQKLLDTLYEGVVKRGVPSSLQVNERRSDYHMGDNTVEGSIIEAIQCG